MSAFFSSVDLKDEVGTRYYGVIGKIDNPLPEMVVRAASNGKEVKLNITDIFSDDLGVTLSSNYAVPESDYANITEFVSTFKYGQYGVQKGNSSAAGYGGWTGDDYEDYYDAQGWNLYPSNKTAAKTNSNFLGVPKNPFNEIYALINRVRYGVKYTPTTALEFMNTALACTLKYADESGAEVVELYELSDQLEKLVADEFAKTITALDAETTETTNVNQSKCS